MLAPARDRLTFYGHSSLFYWWPVWVVGFLMAIVTWASPTRSVTVDHDAAFVSDPVGDSWTMKHGPHSEQMLHVSASKNVGVLFTVVLLLVVIVTNVPMRGMASVVVIGCIVLFSVVAAWQNWWEEIIHRLDLLDVRINMGGYLLISVVLFAAWLIVVVFFDRQIYALFEPGEIEIRDHIGGAAQAFPGPDVTLAKKPSDLFRHWVIGFGSGDIIIHVKSAGGTQTFEFANVMFADRQIRQATRLLRMVRTERERAERPQEVGR